jgi:hypothetical protein
MFNMSVIIRVVILRSSLTRLRTFSMFSSVRMETGRPQSTPDRHETSQTTRTHAQGVDTRLYKPFLGLQTLSSHFYPTYNKTLLLNAAPSSNFWHSAPLTLRYKCRNSRSTEVIFTGLRSIQRAHSSGSNGVPFFNVGFTVRTGTNQSRYLIFTLCMYECMYVCVYVSYRTSWSSG